MQVSSRPHQLISRVDPCVVVVADGQPDRAGAIAAHLDGAGNSVLSTHSAAEAMACCQKAPDAELMILDADLDGAMLLLDTMWTDRSLRRIPVVTISTENNVLQAVECLDRGARDHVRAPFAPEELLARIGAVLRVADDQERLRRRNSELEFLGSMDDLTGLANRRHIEEELDRLAAAAARHHQPLAALLLAVDGWGALEAAGSPVADAVLQEVAVLIGAIVRTGDVAGRFDNERFLVLLPMTSGDGARVFGERLRAVVSAAPIITTGGPVDVSISAGCADGAPGAAELLARANLALQQAQDAGGDILVAIRA